MHTFQGYGEGTEGVRGTDIILNGRGTDPVPLEPCRTPTVPSPYPRTPVPPVPSPVPSRLRGAGVRQGCGRGAAGGTERVQGGQGSGKEGTGVQGCTLSLRLYGDATPAQRALATTQPTLGCLELHDHAPCGALRLGRPLRDRSRLASEQLSNRCVKRDQVAKPSFDHG